MHIGFYTNAYYPTVSGVVRSVSSFRDVLADQDLGKFVERYPGHPHGKMLPTAGAASAWATCERAEARTRQASKCSLACTIGARLTTTCRNSMLLGVGSGNRRDPAIWIVPETLNYDS